MPNSDRACSAATICIFVLRKCLSPLCLAGNGKGGGKEQYSVRKISLWIRAESTESHRVASEMPPAPSTA